MRFEYKKYTSGGEVRTRPVIPIEISNPATGLEVGYEVLIDSGSDICIFDRQIGELLGYEFSKASTAGAVRGITGEFKNVHKAKVNLKVGDWPFELGAYFMTLAEGNKYGIVGQDGYFDLFTVTFDNLKEKIKVKPRK